MTKAELNTLWKDYPYEFKEMTLHEFKLLVSWRMRLRGITKWDEFQEEFIEDLRQSHNDHLLGLGIQADEKLMQREDS